MPPVGFEPTISVGERPQTYALDRAATGSGIIITIIIIIVIVIIINWYEHVPKSVETGQGGNVTILWNQQVQTDRTIPNNKPDIIIRGNEKRTCMLIDVAISGAEI